MVTTIGSGLGSSLGFGVESSSPPYGVPVAPTRWVEFLSETIAWKPKRIIGKGLLAGGLVPLNSSRQQPNSTVEGDFKTPLYWKGLGLPLASLMGTLGGSGYALGFSAPGKSLTIQKGVPEIATGLVNPYTYAGCKVIKGVFEFSSDDYVQCTFTIDGRSFDVGITAYTPPVLQAANGIHAFSTSSITMGGTIVEGIRKATLTIKRPTNVNTFYMDATGLKQEQVQNDPCELTLDLESDYITDAAFCAQFFADPVTPVVIGSVSGSNTFSATLPNMRWEEGPPMISGPDLVQAKLQLIGLVNDASSPPWPNPCTLAYSGGV